MQLAIGEQKRRRGSEARSGAGEVSIASRIATCVDRLRSILVLLFERIKRAQTHGSQRKQMKLVESLALGNRRQLLLVSCENQRYLVGVGADSVGSILAIDGGAASRDRTAKGPELVRRRGREVSHEARSRAAESGLDSWH